MMSEDEQPSVPSDIAGLCGLVLGAPYKAGLLQPDNTYQHQLRSLKLTAWNTLLQQHSGPHCMEPQMICHDVLSEVDRVYAHAYEFRTKRQFDKASRIEHLVEQLVDSTTGGDELAAVLRLLLSLEGTRHAEESATIGHRHMIPVTVINSNDTVILPDGPLQYGDTQLHTVEHQYMHYPSELFEQPGLVVNRTEDKHSLIQIFESKPGSHLPGIFQAKGSLGDDYEETTYSSLYGALVQTRMSSLDIHLDLHLDLPDLADENKPPEIKIPKVYENSEEDEGFAEKSSSVSSGHVTPDDSGLGDTKASTHWMDDDIWHRALQHVPSHHRVWENRGCTPGLTERPYLSEAGCEALDHLWAVHMFNLQLIDPTIQLARRQVVQMDKLVRDIVNLLLGVPSTSFLLNEATEELYISPGLFMSGLTPEGLAEACGEAMKCGTNYRRLAAFSQSVVMDSFYHSGLIFQAFTGAVAKYLQHYRGCILSISEGKTLTEMNFLLHRVYLQIRLLAELCQCVPPTGGDTGDELFPTGVHLLSYLYKYTLEVAGSQHYSMLLSLLNTSCGPYLMFVQDWVFHGICQDLYGEFMIQMNDDYLRFRDKHYWTRGYVMLATDAVTSVPLFLSDLANDMFVCGKSINLLKLCAPQHFLFTVDQEVPRVMITFSEEEISTTETTCQGYLSRMQQIAKMKSLSRRQMLEKAERAKQELIIEARRAAARDLARIHAKADAQKKAIDARKRRLFSQLKDQMESDKKRRATDREQERDEGKAWIEDFNKQEVLEAKVDEELEKQAKEELVDYYAKLSADASLREQRALWKVRRGHLDDARQNFILDDEAKLAQELEQLRNGGNNVEDDGVFLPDAPLTSEEVATVPGQFLTNQDALPAWAREGLKTAAPSFGVENTGSLPSWAKQGIERTDGQTIEVMELEFAELGRESVAVNKTVTVETVKEVTESKVKSSENDSADNVEHGEKVKHHVSDSSVSDVMRSEPVLRPQVDGVRHLGLQKPDKPEYSHPSASSIQTLMYTEPQPSKTLSQSIVGPSGESLQTVIPPVAQISVIDPSESNTKPIVGGEDIHVIQTVSENQADCTDQTVCEASNVSEKPATGDDHKDISDNISTATQSPKPSRSDPVPKLTPKPKIRLMEDKHATTESTEEVIVRPSVKINQGSSVLTESQPAVDKSTIRSVDGRNVNEQTEEAQEKRHTKMSGTMSATSQSEEAVERPHLRIVEDRHVNVESESVVQRSGTMRSEDMHATKQSEQVVMKVKPRSKFGHVSELSRADGTVQLPKLKRSNTMHTSMESDYRCYQIKPHRRRPTAAQSIDQETEEVKYRPRIRLDPSHHASAESTRRDVDGDRLSRFKERNIKGHASDSTVEKLLYGHTVDQVLPDEFVRTEIVLVTNSELEPYDDQFDTLDSSPVVDLTAGLSRVPFGGFGDYGISTNSDVTAHEFISLPALLKRSIKAPLVAQISLVNESIVNYFTTELDLDGHMGALRHFLLMEDGEFGQCLSELLFEKLAHSPQIHEVFNPMFLNNVLSSAMRASMHGDDKYTTNISFTLRYLPQMIKPNAPQALDCLELTYKVPWPMNIIITDNSLNKYSRISSFMLQLKRVVWVLKDVWHKLKRDALINNASAGWQFRQLQLHRWVAYHRHEMQYLVRVLQGYLANQVIHVTWLELREDLGSNVHNLDDLHNCHGNYLNKCLSRCLLNKKAEPVMKIIQDIFGLILKFRMQLVSSNWQRDDTTGQVTHPSFEHMCSTYDTFLNYSKFLFRVVRKLEIMGYEPHLQELLLRLNYNKYYSNTT